MTKSSCTVIFMELKIVTPAQAGVSLVMPIEIPAGACPRMIESGAGMTTAGFVINLKTASSGPWSAHL